MKCLRGVLPIVVLLVLAAILFAAPVATQADEGQGQTPPPTHPRPGAPVDVWAGVMLVVFSLPTLMMM